MTEIKFYGSSEFEELKPYWEKLQTGDDMTVFQQYIWYYGLNRQYLCKCFKPWESAVYAVAFKNGEPAMIAPLHIKRLGCSYKGIGNSAGAYFIGNWSFTDYQCFIYREFDKDVFEELIAAFRNKYRVRKITLNFLRQSTQMAVYLNGREKSRKLFETICVQTLPHDSFEEFHRTMTKYSRQNIRKAFNRENKTEMEIHIEEHGRISQKDADEFFSIYLERSGVKNELNLKEDGLKKTLIKYTNKRYNTRLKDGLNRFNYITYNMVNNPDSYMIGIYNNTRKIGFIYGITEGKIWRNIIVCFDEEYKYYTPGRTAYFRYFRDILYADGKGTDVTVDMSRGTERHKYELGGTEHYLDSFEL